MIVLRSGSLIPESRDGQYTSVRIKSVAMVIEADGARHQARLYQWPSGNPEPERSTGAYVLTDAVDSLDLDLSSPPPAPITAQASLLARWLQQLPSTVETVLVRRIGDTFYAATAEYRAAIERPSPDRREWVFPADGGPSFGNTPKVLEPVDHAHWAVIEEHLASRAMIIRFWVEAEKDDPDSSLDNAIRAARYWTSDFDVIGR